MPPQGQTRLGDDRPDHVRGLLLRHRGAPQESGPNRQQVGRSVELRRASQKIQEAWRGRLRFLLSGRRGRGYQDLLQARLRVRADARVRRCQPHFGPNTAVLQQGIPHYIYLRLRRHFHLRHDEARKRA